MDGISADSGNKNILKTKIEIQEEKMPTPEVYYRRLGENSNCCWKTLAEFSSHTQKAILGLFFIVFLVICIACYLPSTQLLIPHEKDKSYDQYLSIGNEHKYTRKYWNNGLKTTQIDTTYYYNNKKKKVIIGNNKNKGKPKEKIADNLVRENSNDNVQFGGFGYLGGLSPDLSGGTTKHGGVISGRSRSSSHSAEIEIEVNHGNLQHGDQSQILLPEGVPAPGQQLQVPGTTSVEESLQHFTADPPDEGGGKEGHMGCVTRKRSLMA